MFNSAMSELAYHFFNESMKIIMITLILNSIYTLNKLCSTNLFDSPTFNYFFLVYNNVLVFSCILDIQISSPEEYYLVKDTKRVGKRLTLHFI